MTGDCKRSERSEISTVFERDQTERDNYQQDRLLVDMPAEQKGRISAECQSSYESVPSWSEEELDKCRLYTN
jgi:hypothetical protein